jgi:hypothetical protein
MKKISTAVVAAALVIGLGGTMTTAPALAKRDQAPTGPIIAPDVRAALVEAQRALAATPRDIASAESALAILDARKGNDSEKYFADQIRLAIQDARISALPEGQRIYTAEAATLDALLANPVTPRSDIGRYTYGRANIAFNVRQYDVAARLYARARDAGFIDPDLLISLAKAKMDSGDVAGGAIEMAAAMKSEQTAGRKVPENWYRFTISRLYRANDLDDALAWSRAWLTDYGTRENWRDAIMQFGLQNPGKNLSDRNRLDLYRLMRATHSVGGEKEWLDYAAVALKVGLPAEAKGATDAAQAANSTPAVKATGLRSPRGGRAAGKGSAAASRSGISDANSGGDVLLGTQDFAKAADKYRAALASNTGDADTLNLHLGMALAMAGDKAGAQTALSAVKSGANLDIARLWTTYTLSAPVP